MRAKRATRCAWCHLFGDPTRTLLGVLPVPRRPPSELRPSTRFIAVLWAEVATVSPFLSRPKETALSSGHHRAGALRSPVHPRPWAVAPLDPRPVFGTGFDQRATSLSLWKPMTRSSSRPWTLRPAFRPRLTTMGHFAAPWTPFDRPRAGRPPRAGRGARGACAAPVTP